MLSMIPASPLSINTLDLIIGFGLLWGAFNGFRRGLIREIIALVGILFSLYLAFHYCFILEDFLNKNTETDASTRRILAFTAIFVISFICLKIIGTLLTKLMSLFALGLLNRFFGALFGGLKIVLLAAAILLLLASIKGEENFLTPEIAETSIFYPPLSHLGHQLFPLLQDNLEQHNINIPGDF